MGEPIGGTNWGNQWGNHGTLKFWAPDKKMGETERKVEGTNGGTTGLWNFGRPTRKLGKLKEKLEEPTGEPRGNKNWRTMCDQHGINIARTPFS